MKLSLPNASVSTVRAQDLEETQEDRRILSAVLSGVPGAFEGLYMRWTPIVERVVRRMLNRLGVREKIDLDDAMQEVWAHVTVSDYRVLRCYNRESGAPRAYLTVVAQRKVRDLARKVRPYASADEDAHATDDIACPARFDAQVEAREVAEQVVEKLQDELNPKGQVTLQAVYLEECSVPEAVAKTGLSVRSIYNWCHRIRESARQIRDGMNALPQRSYRPMHRVARTDASGVLRGRRALR